LAILSAIVYPSCMSPSASHSAAMVVNASGPVRAAALVGVVLAGGEGRRMGTGALKPLRLLGGRPMVAHVVERLRPQVMDVVVVANDRPAAFRSLKVAAISPTCRGLPRKRAGGWARSPASWPAWNGR
jgi:hypothetical protein